MSEPTSYHGQPLLKAPVWGWEIPTYLFAGGLAGASAGLGYLAGLRGNAALSRRAWLTSSLSISASPPLLIADLGRPERFFYMLRMIKVTSPMSMGTWFLAFCGAGTSLSALHAYTGRLPRAAAVARPIAALSGLPLATYTGALLANTAVPAWHEASRTLPFVFGAGAALSAGGVAAALTPLEHAGPARRLALGAAIAELAATQVMERGLGVHAETFHAGRPMTWSRLSRGCIVAGAALLHRRGAHSRPAAVASGALLVTAAIATRWSVFEAGRSSAADPRYVIGPQRQRVDARARAAGGAAAAAAAAAATEAAAAAGGGEPAHS